MLTEHQLRTWHRATNAWARKEQQWGSAFRQAVRYIMPERRGHYYHGTSKQDVGSEIHDSTAIKASTALANAFVASLTPPWSPWAVLEPGPQQMRLIKDKREQAALKREYFILSSVISAEINNRSKFLQAVLSAYKDMQMGFGGYLLEPHSDGQHLRFTNIPAEDVALEATIDGDLDYVYHYVCYTGGELIEMFGPEAANPQHRGRLSGEFLKICQNNPSDTHNFWKTVTPIHGTGRYQLYLLPVEGMYTRFGRAMMDDVLDWNPYIFWRYDTVPHSVYGRGPGVEMYYDIRFLNNIKDMAMQAAAWGTSPTFMVADSGVVNAFTARIEPGSNIPVGTGYAGSEPAKQLQVETNFDIAQWAIETGRTDIRRGFYVDRFGERGKTPASAAEIFERSRVINQDHGSTASLIEQEGLFRTWRIAMKIMQSQGRLAKSEFLNLDRRNLDITFLSAMAQARRDQDINNLVEFYSIATQLSQLDSGTRYVPDAQAGLRHIAMLRSIPPELVRSDEEVMQIQQTVAQQAQAAGQAQLEMERPV